MINKINSIEGELNWVIKQKFRKLLYKSGFKDIAMLSSGVLLAQVITFLCQPIATRLYSPDAFGVLSIIVSIVAIITPISTLQYHSAVVLAENEGEANAVCSLSFYVVIIMSLLTAIGLIVFNIIYPTTFEKIGYWVFIVIPMVLLSGVSNIVSSYNNRYKQYKLITTVSIMRSIISNALTLLLGFIKLDSVGLIISQFVSNVFGIRRQANYLISKYKEILHTPYQLIRETALKYKEQPFYAMPGLFVTTFSFSIIPININSLYGIEEAGYFSLSMSVLGVPLSLISINVAKVFFRNATSEYNRNGNFKSTFSMMLTLLTIISTIGFGLLWIFVEPLFSLIYSESWISSGTFAKILIPMFALRFIVQALMNGFIISGNQFYKLIIQCLFIVSAVAVYFIVKLNDFEINTYLQLINATYFINYLILLTGLYFISKHGGKKSEKNKSFLRKN